MLLITVLTRTMELSLSRVATTDIMLILPQLDALCALLAVPVALVRLCAHDVLAMRTPMQLASATLVIRQLKAVLVAVSVVLLSGAIPVFKGKDL